MEVRNRRTSQKQKSEGTTPSLESRKRKYFPDSGRLEIGMLMDVGSMARRGITRTNVPS